MILVTSHVTLDVKKNRNATLLSWKKPDQKGTSNTFSLRIIDH